MPNHFLSCLQLLLVVPLELPETWLLLDLPILLQLLLLVPLELPETWLVLHLPMVLLPLLSYLDWADQGTLQP